MSTARALLLLVLFVAPAASAQWAQTAGPPGGPLHELAAADGALLGSSSGALFRLSGGTWTLPAVPAVGELHAVGSHVFAAYGAGAFFRSADAGATFDSVAAPSSDARLLAYDGLVLSAFDFDTLFVSTDDGDTWTARSETAWVTFGTSTFEVALEIRDATTSGSTMLAGGAAYVFGGVFRLAPGDTAWVPVLQTGQNTRVDDLVRHDGRLFAASTVGVFVSADGGATWTPLNAGLPTTGLSVELLPGAGALFAYVPNGDFFRLDGAVWTLLPDPPIAFALDVAASDRLYASGTSNVYAFDGAAWTTLPAHLGSSPFVLDARGATATARSEGRLWRTTTTGATWTALAPTGVGAAVLAPPLALASATGGFQRSSNDGATWTAGGAAPLPSGHAGLRPVVLVAHDGSFWAAYAFRRYGKHGIPLETFGGVYRSADGGASWTNATANLPPTSLGPTPVDALFSANDRLFAFAQSGCFTSTGGDWTAVPCPGASVRALVVLHLMQPGTTRLLALTGNDLRGSDDAGASWTANTSGLPLPSDPTALARFWSTARLAALPDGAFLAAEVDGVTRGFRTMGFAWDEDLKLSPLPAGVSWFNFVAGGELYGGSFGRGVWTSPLGVATAPEPSGPPAPALALSAPTPSPSRGAVRVALTVGTAGSARVSVFDALGRRVAVLHDGPLAAGTHPLALDAARLAPGLYVVRAEGAEGIVSRRLVVLR